MNYKFLFFALFLLVSCNELEAPKFQTIDAISVKKINGNTITISAKAHFKNPNLLGGTFKTDSIQVFVNQVQVGTVSSTSDFTVPAKEEFSVPLQAIIPLEKIYTNQNSLGGIINSIFSKKITIQYKGDLIYKALGLHYSYPIDVTEEITLKKKK